jgi:hypothetical protein
MADQDNWDDYLQPIAGLDSAGAGIAKLRTWIQGYATIVFEKLFKKARERDSDFKWPYPNNLRWSEIKQLIEQKEKTKKTKKKEDDEEEEKEPVIRFTYKVTEKKKKDVVGKDGKKKKVAIEETEEKEKDKAPVAPFSVPSQSELIYMILKFGKETLNYYKGNNNKWPTDKDNAFYDKFVKDLATPTKMIDNIAPAIRKITQIVRTDDWFPQAFDNGALKEIIRNKFKNHYESKNIKGSDNALDHFTDLLVKFIKVIAIYYGIENYNKRNPTLTLCSVMRLMNATLYSLKDPSATFSEGTFSDCSKYIAWKKTANKTRTKKTSGKAISEETEQINEEETNDAINEAAGDDWNDNATYGDTEEPKEEENLED